MAAAEAEKEEDRELAAALRLGKWVRLVGGVDGCISKHARVHRSDAGSSCRCGGARGV